MINNSDLRTGNWLYGYDPASMPYGKTGYFQVENIYEDKVNLWQVDGFGDESATGQGIPLTPELLEKCGFEKDGDFLSLVVGWSGVLKLSTSYEPGVVKLYCPFDEATGQTPGITFLHQLQNLFYFLSGEELQVKL